MAERRMFSKTIIDSDIFLDMPQTTQNLYFHLNMRADDEGFVNSPKKIMRMVGSNQNDLEILLSKRYLIAFKSGVIVIKHFKLHNTIRKDRMKETLYLEEKALLMEKENGSYTELQPDDNQLSTNCTHSVLECSVVKSIIVESNTAEPKPKKDEEDKDKDKIKDIIAYLNSVTSSNYRAKSTNTKKHIKARIAEGYSYDDFTIVIDKKYREWNGTDMERYLCPDTLFGSKFEKYLNQKIVNSKPVEQETTEEELEAIWK